MTRSPENFNEKCLHLSFRWPNAGSSRFQDDFFLGIWHPTTSIAIRLKNRDNSDIAFQHGKNWSLWSSRSLLHETKPGLLHRQGAFCTAFRGYTLDPPIHSYSASDSVVSYWRNAFAVRHNGVFSAATIDESCNSLVLITDAFGFAPLYYRYLFGAIAFSTNPRLLRASDDKPDWLARLARVQAGFISSDRTLTSEIKRVPAGQAVFGDAAGIRLSSWFDFDSLPDGGRKVTDSAFSEVERQFQSTIARCIRLHEGKNVLPLSSGHDSRRILAAFLSQKAKFTAITVRVHQKSFRDLDARFAAQMASDFDFEHRIVELPGTKQYVEHDRLRRILVDAETSFHTWVISLAENLPDSPTMIYDGVLGDILGNPGYRMGGMYKSPRTDLNLILDEALDPALDSVLRRAAWPTDDDLRADLESYLSQFAHRYNMAEFAFILLRQRRSISSWSQQLIPSGHVVVCPYLDLDYISLLLEFDPKQKHQAVFQRQCLHRFWPEFARYAGNRDIPTEIPPGASTCYLEKNAACFRAVYKELADHKRLSDALRLLTGYKRLSVVLAKLIANAFPKAWGAYQVLEVQARDISSIPCWSRDNIQFPPSQIG